MTPGPKPTMSAKWGKQCFGSIAQDLKLVHADSTSAMFTIDSNAYTEDMRANGNMNRTARTHQKQWMTSQPQVKIVDALRTLEYIHSTHDNPPQWIEAMRNIIHQLDTKSSALEIDKLISTMLDIFLANDIDSKDLKASGIYSGTEFLLICSVDSIRSKAVKLINKWRGALNRSPVDMRITAIVTSTDEQLRNFQELAVKDMCLKAGIMLGLTWAMDQASSEDHVQGWYARKTLAYSAPCLLPDRDYRNISSEIYTARGYNCLSKDIRSRFSNLDVFWHHVTAASPLALPNHVDCWNIVAQVGFDRVMSLNVAEIYYSLAGNDPDGVLESAATSPKHSTEIPIAQRSPAKDGFNDCGRHGDEALTSDFFTQHQSPSFRRIMSELHDENQHVHNHIDYISFDRFVGWFDESTRICRGILPRLEKEIEELHSNWPELLCEIEFNVRTAMHGKEMYHAMRETLQNMENNIATYCSDAHVRDRELAYLDLEAFRRKCKECEPTGMYLPSSCELHRIQQRLMHMVCRPVKALWDIESVMSADQQRKLEAKTSQISQLTTEVQEREALISKGRDRLNVMEEKCKILKAQLEEAEQVAAAKARIEVEKQKSKYYQDVEKGVGETSSALRGQLDAARAEGLLYRQTLADNAKLNAEMAKMKQEMTHLRATKSQKEADCKVAEDATKAITEGYNQLRETNASGETRIAELEADLEKSVEEQDQLRDEINKLKAMNKATIPTQSRSTDNYVIFHPTSIEEKKEKELQHLDSTIVVWKRTLAEAKTKRDKTKKQRDEVHVRIAYMEKQIKELKDLKTSKTKPPSATTPWANPPLSAQPANLIMVPSAIRKTAPEQEQFPVLCPAPMPSNTLRGDAQVFSSMRIKTAVNKKALQPQTSASESATGGKEGTGGWQRQQSKRGGWGN
ncbi:hypothetical protein DE146DRAFT_770101 [Phaeosphaeria sp. MPI-PUGE-AT-0046c]|nr:hypothetical protein DE146DRAFT_770101 [Phaeosphaeria sp. MPI-PUGE-AT-0046c]